MIKRSLPSRLSTGELQDLFKAQSHATIVQRARDELRSGTAALPRPVLMHAMAVALASQVQARRPLPAAGQQGAGTTFDLNAWNTLTEAADVFEALLCLDGEERAQADLFGDTAGNCARCFKQLRGLSGESRPVRQQPDPARVFEELMFHAAGFVTARQLAEAEALLTRAREITLSVEGEEGPSSRASIHVLRVLREFLGDRLGATICHEKADFEAALDDARLLYAEEGRVAYLGVVHQFAWAAWSGALFELARRTLLHAMAVHRHQAAQAGDVSPLAEALVHLGRISLAAANYSSSFHTFEELRRLGEGQGAAAAWRDAALAGLGRTWWGLGDLKLGRALLRDALGPSPRTAEAGWHEDALLHAYEAALEAGDGQTARACHRSLAAGGDPRATSFGEIEAVGLEAADPARALALYRDILASLARVPERHSAAQRLLWRVARLHAAQGETQQAYEVLQQLHHAATNVLDSDHSFLSEVEGLAAILEHALGRHEWALNALLKATARDSRAAAHLLQAGSAAPRNRTLAGMRQRAEAAIGLVAEHFPDAHDFIGGVHAVALRRKGLNLAIEKEIARRTAEMAARDPAVREARNGLATLRMRLGRAALDQARVGAGLEATLLEKEALEREIAYLLGGIKIAGLIEVSNPASIAMSLPENSAYLDIYRYVPIGLPGERQPRPARYCVFILQARYLKWKVVPLGEAAKVDRLVSQVRSGIAKRGDREASFATVVPERDGATERHLSTRKAGEPTSDAAWQRRTTPGHRLRRRVLDRLLPFIKERTRLVVSPDGPLSSLPFECLPADDGGHLIDRYCFSYVTSAHAATYMGGSVISSAEAAAAAAPPLVLGDPAYDAAGSGGTTHFRPLPGSRQEAVDVAKVLGVPALLGPDATKAVVAAASNPLVMHLATHGYAFGAAGVDGELAELPLLRTGLAFAGANAASGVADGILVAEEVMSLNLQRTALAVLSACETGLGDPEHGEGLASLGRTFEAAGARAVLVGLWKVPDEQTREVMQRFYAALKAGQGCAEAIWQAKLDMKRLHPAPYDWGAFVCFGGWGSIAINRAIAG